MVSAGEAVQQALDPVFRKRGFASRDIIARWTAMAPPPYHRVAAPDRLVWPRNERNAGGATLYLRCAPGHALALSHEGQAIAAAVNRYFGYVLVGAVRLAAEPLATGPQPRQSPAPRAPETDAEIDRAVAGVADDGLKGALRRLGRGIKGNSGR